MGERRRDLLDVVRHQHDRRLTPDPRPAHRGGRPTLPGHRGRARPPVRPSAPVPRRPSAPGRAAPAGAHRSTGSRRPVRPPNPTPCASSRPWARSASAGRVRVPPRFERGVARRHHDLGRVERRADHVGERGADQGDPLPQGSDVGVPEALAEHVDGAAARVFVQRGDADERGLSAAVGARARPSARRRDLPVDVVDEVSTAAGERDVGKSEDRPGSRGRIGAHDQVVGQRQVHRAASGSPGRRAPVRRPPDPRTRG